MRLAATVPPREYVLAQIARGTLLWVLVRLLITSMAAAVTPPTGHLFLLPPVITAAVIGIVAFLARVDARIMRERLFHENLGIPALLTPALAALAAIMLEVCVRLLT
jgi:hypothetical protein